MRSARVWLWVVLLAAAACVCVSIVGWISTVGGLWFWEPTLFGAVSALFVLPGFAVSLAVDAILLHLRRPAPVRTAEAVLLIVVLAVVAALLLVGQWEPLFGWEFVLWPAGILAAIAVSVVLGVGNGLAREQPGPADLADRAFGTPPA